MSLQRAGLSAPPRLVLTVAVTPPQLQQAVYFDLYQMTSPPQHQIGRESLKRENPHEEESVAWAVDQMEEEEVVGVVVEVVYGQLGREVGGV